MVQVLAGTAGRRSIGCLVMYHRAERHDTGPTDSHYNTWWSRSTIGLCENGQLVMTMNAPAGKGWIEV
jgi:hypothetical protein